MARRPRDSEWISEVRVLALLEVSRTALEGHIRRHHVDSRRIGSTPSVFLADLLVALPPALARQLREAMHAERMAVRTSKQWVAGFPDLIAEWHPTKNVDVYPDQIRAGSHVMIWWKCPLGPDHEWRARPNHRTDGRGCPFCRGLKASITNSVAALRPELVAEWHPTKNRQLRPDAITIQSHRPVWWRCAKNPGHEWRTAPTYRYGCPYCDGKKLSAEHSLVAEYPKVAAEWHPKRNGERTPATTHAGSDKPAWWRCVDGHEWEAVVRKRTRRGQGCPQCHRGA